MACSTSSSFISSSNAITTWYSTFSLIFLSNIDHGDLISFVSKPSMLVISWRSFINLKWKARNPLKTIWVGVLTTMIMFILLHAYCIKLFIITHLKVVQKLRPCNLYIQHHIICGNVHRQSITLSLFNCWRSLNFCFHIDECRIPQGWISC